MRILRHFGTISLLTAAFLFLLPACRKVDVDFGSQFLDDGHTEIIKFDTLTPALSTIFVDSFPTSSTGVALLGSYTDPYFGKISAQPYYELAPPSSTVTPIPQATFDSIEVIIAPNGTSYGDTTKAATFRVFQLAENIVIPVTTGVLFNTSSIPLEPTALGQITTTLRPQRKDSIRIRLSDALGIDLFQKLRAKDERVTERDKFILYFKGLSIVSDANNVATLGCTDAITMRIHYREPDINVSKKTIDFTLNTSSHQFNRITIDRTNTPLGDAGFGTTQAKKEISSSQTNKAAFVQYSTGAMTKITFPSIRTILQVPHFSKILQANLIIKPVKASFQYPYTLPKSLRLSATDLNNQLGNDLAMSTGNGMVTQTGNLAIDLRDPNNTGYSYDVTSYINGVLLSPSGANAPVAGLGLLLATPANAHISTFDRLIVADHTPGNNGIQLVVYYLTVK